MECSWEETGFLQGRLDTIAQKSGGQWTIGDSQTISHPGHSTNLMYKTWVASGGRYQPGSYPYKDRLDEGLWEYVMCMHGTLIAKHKHPDHGDLATIATLSPGSMAEVPPGDLRAWELPENEVEARGLTILWLGDGMRTSHGIGNIGQGFHFTRWEHGNASSRLNKEPMASHIQTQYIEVFHGSLTFASDRISGNLAAGDFMYVHTETPIKFECKETETVGIVIYY